MASITDQYMQSREACVSAQNRLNELIRLLQAVATGLENENFMFSNVATGRHDGLRGDLVRFDGNRWPTANDINRTLEEALRFERQCDQHYTQLSDEQRSGVSAPPRRRRVRG